MTRLIEQLKVHTRYIVDTRRKYETRSYKTDTYRIRTMTSKTTDSERWTPSWGLKKKVEAIHRRVKLSLPSIDGDRKGEEDSERVNDECVGLDSSYFRERMKEVRCESDAFPPTVPETRTPSFESEEPPSIPETTILSLKVQADQCAKQGNLSDAVRLYTEYLSSSSKDSDTTTSALSNRAALLLRLDRSKEAIQDCQRLLNEFPGLSESIRSKARFRLASAYMKLNDRLSARQQLLLLAEAEPHNARVRKLLSQTHCRT